VGYVRDAPVVVLTGMAFEADIAASSHVIYGLRGDALEQALHQRLQQPCAGLISFGMAGGLSPDLAPGAVVVAQAVADAHALLATDPAWSEALLRALPQAVGGLLAGVDAPVATVADKQALHHADAALAADMESHIGARAARQAGVPYAVCRVVLDPALQTVPPAALAAFGRDGGINFPALLSNLLRHPGQLPDLLRLGRDSSSAQQAMREVRAALGPRFGLPYLAGGLASSTSS